MKFLLIQIKESFWFAINALVVNRLRTFLSLIGITIGIFAIIFVFTVIDSLKNNIKNSIESLGNNVVYIQKWPWEFSNEYKWWKYMNRPLPTIKEYEEIKNRSNKIDAASFVAFTNKNVDYKGNFIENVTVISASYDYDKIRSFEIEKGRYFSFFESNNGSAKAIIGSKVALQLFKNINPIGKQIKILGKKISVLGVFKNEGASLFDEGLDNSVLLPVNFSRNIFDLRDEQLNPTIMVRAKQNVGITELSDNLSELLRGIRRLRPLDDNNFALNKTSLITQGFDDLFNIVDLAGLLIGGLAIIVGGFGIANIMFVSVKERTKIIGIQKSLGAKNYFILIQFLSESVMLSLIGGLIGLLLVYIATILGSRFVEMEFSMNFYNIFSGILISVVIGIISGIAPALSASKLNPVDAINSNF